MSGSASSPLILTYHSIRDGDSPLEIPPAVFAGQMAWLREHAQVIPLGTLVRALAEKRGLPERSVVLTFDDGFADFAEAAAPLLVKHSLPATVFLPTAWCGKTNAWPGQPPWVKPQPLLTWNAVGQLAQQGIEFGGHSVSHPVLPDVPAAELEQEISGCQEEIARVTGQRAQFFCYPYGRWNDSVRRLVKEHYAGACSTAAGRVARNSDPYSLPRVDAHYVRSPQLFRGMLSAWFAGYVALRRWVRRLRGQPEGYLSRL
jgi:peptidoglycan/xylan/chitin deacetylase (PgdA/CDA1 family)